MGTSTRGFTLIEILVVVVVVGILVSIALPNFIQSQDKVRLAQVKSNMHAAQVCAEQYKTDVGHYPANPSDLYPYFPNGGGTPGGVSGNLPLNPFSNAPDPMYKESLSTTADVQALRQSGSSGGSGSNGSVGYTPVDSLDSYAICGLDVAGKRIQQGTGTLVLSNQ